MPIVDLSKYVEPLGRAPRMLRAVIEGQPDSWLDSQHDPTVGSPRQAVAHLLNCEMDPWTNRIRWALNPEFSYEEGAASAELLDKHSLSDLLDMFEHERAQALEDLAAMNLTKADLDHTVTEEGFGTYSVRNLLTCWVAHDLYHMGQIFKSYSAQFQDDENEAGAWDSRRRAMWMKRDPRVAVNIIADLINFQLDFQQD